MLLLQEELNSSYQKFYSYFSNGDNEHFFNTILKFVKRAYYIHYLIMMVIGLERMQLTLVLVVYGLEIQKAIEKIEKSFLAELDKINLP